MSSGPVATVVLLHGFTQTGASWQPVVTRLGGHGTTSRPITVRCPDLPGHGDRGEVVTDLDGAARLVADECGRAVYVGYSMGGRVALHLALARPDLVERLVLVGATPGIEDADERAARVADDEQLAQRIERDGVERFLESWLSLPLFASLPPEARSLDTRLVNTATGLASSLRTCGTGRQADLWGRLGQIRCPTVVVAGQHDEKFADIGRRMTALLPDARFVAVAGAGHAVHLERPDVVAGLIGEEMAEVTPPSARDRSTATRRRPTAPGRSRRAPG